MPILLCWLRQTKGWVEFSGMKPSPAVSGACSSVSYWPSISSDPALGWLCLHQQQKQKSKVYFPAVDTLSASGKWQTGHNTVGLWDSQVWGCHQHCATLWHPTWWGCSCSWDISYPGTSSTQILPFLCHTRTRPWKMKLPAWKQQGKAHEELSGKLKTGNV